MRNWGGDGVGESLTELTEDALDLHGDVLK